MTKPSIRRPLMDRLLCALAGPAPRICAVGILCILLAVNSAPGGTGFSVVLPGWPQTQANQFAPIATPSQAGAPTTPATGNKSGLVLRLDSTWIEGNGYRPVRVTVTPTTPTTADRSLRVSFRPGNYRGPTIAVTRDIELAAGFTSVTETLSVPQFGMWQTFAFDVFEDGDYVRELSVPQNGMGFGIGGQYSGDNSSPTILMLNSTDNSNNMLNALGRAGQPVLQIGPTNSVSTSSTLIPGNPRRLLTFNLSSPIPTMADLPVRWLDYTMLDIVVASRQDLQTLVKQHPKQWQAIRRWIRAGGNLWVYGVGEVPPQQSFLQWNLANEKPWVYLAEINEWIAFSDSGEVSSWPAIPALAGWRPWDPRAPYIPPTQFSSVMVVPQTATTTVEAPDASNYATSSDEGALRSGEPKFPFVLRPLGMGTIVAIPTANALNDNQFPWERVFTNVSNENWQWPLRNGVNFTSPNDNYWNFLIPGVGAAPVTAFQVLITLFVLAIGPLNFYLLRRWQKLNLLLVTVPASAAVVTVALLLYAILADGFGVRVRTRSFTELNQQTGEATCLGRIAYYAGLTPAKGLSFSGDVAVYPLGETPVASQFEAGATRRLAWEFKGEDDAAGVQRLESGWLQSRIQTQLVTVRSRTTNARLAISTDDGGAPSVTNALGVPVSTLLVCDAKGSFSIARDLAIGGEVVATFIPSGDIPAELAEIMSDTELQPPDGVQLGGSDSIFGIRRRYYGRRAFYNSMPASGMPETSLLERSLTETFRSAIEARLPKRSYVAIVDRSPEFELGIDSATDESSLHVIYGRW